ncbi:hypothetical protein TNIN_26621 [Trichonephila inaurata madagascariensis]|uniref:Uncharacterized protein n=1 Tax=Trichonephila inaurata madagascariensis TaxID=2747483 RepID=A0A8X6XSJ9_9ARAC|nr:hypothetical protein TNIN_26621 [Trichonephila inaurata madagascariensis]
MQPISMLMRPPLLSSVRKSIAWQYIPCHRFSRLKDSVGTLMGLGDDLAQLGREGVSGFQSLCGTFKSFSERFEKGKGEELVERSLFIKRNHKGGE